MLKKSLSGFIQDERGSYTMWSVAWFMIYVGIGGLAVDATDVYRHETLLQATGDASSLAGVMSLPNETEAVDQALAYAQDNMQRTSHGTVLVATDVQIGTWNFDERTFAPETADPNAVYVTTRREEANGNPLGMNMLRFLSLAGGGDLWWNVSAESVAARGVPECVRNGLIAQDRLWYTNHNNFYNNICLHAQLIEMGHEGARQNSYEHGVKDGEPYGVSISRGSTASLGYKSQTIASNEDLQAALDSGGVKELWPAESRMVGSYIGMLRDMPDTLNDLKKDEFEKYHSWAFLYDGEGGLTYEDELPDTTFLSNTVYEIFDCDGQLNLSGMEFEANTALVTDCSIHMPAKADLSAGNIIIASTDDTSGGGHSIKLAAQSSLGHPDYCENEGVGGVEVYTPGSVKLAAQTDWNGVRVVAGGDVDLASHNDAYGVSVQSGGTIDFQTHGDFGLCPNRSVEGPFEWRYSLMQ